jgi:hypothetical protein
VTAAVLQPVIVATTNILLVVDLGVIVALNPVVASVLLVVVVFVDMDAVTTCSTVPLVGVEAPTIRHAVPFHISSVSRSVV